MGIFNSGPTKVAFGFGLGVIAAGVVKEILPAFRGLGRPLLKATVKSGLILARDGRVKLAEFRETLADVTAEAEAELAAVPPQVPVNQPLASDLKQKVGVM
jgi:Protein of unknown function (DUF5132)